MSEEDATRREEEDAPISEEEYKEALKDLDMPDFEGDAPTVKRGEEFHVEEGEPRERPRKKKKPRPRRSLRETLRSETTRRILWAIPWIALAITIIAIGDVVFAAAMVALGYIGLREYFTMTERYSGGGEEAFETGLYAPEMHEPDLLIRTSGEQRISNYLLWQCAYSEFVFRDELWPDFTREAFGASLEEYRSRQRRFGARA